MTIRAAAVAAILIGLAISAPTPVGACVCSGSDSGPCVTASAYDAVFVAEVIGGSLVDHGRGVSEMLRYETRNRMRVTEAFHGGVGAEVDVYTHPTGSCAFGFEHGVRYVVYASRRKDGQLATGFCSHTHRVASDKGDLAYLRAAAQAPVPSHGTIEGKAVIAGLNVPLAGVRVVARSGNRRYETTASKDGSYTLAVPIGSYRVSYAVDAALHSREVRVHVVRGGSCVAPAISVFPDGRASGRVVDSSGRPVSNIPVSLTPLTPQDGWRPSNSAITDANGMYSIVRVPPGRFRLTTLGVVEPPRATSIRFALGERKTLPDLVLSESIPLFTVSGTVRLASGSVGAGATVVLMELNYPVTETDSPVRITRHVTADGTGRFVLRALPGTYQLNAYLPNDIHVSTLTEPFDGRGRVNMDLTLRRTLPD